MFKKIPAHFIGNRVFVQPVTDGGVRLKFYTDTGGGGMFIEPDTVKRLGLEVFKRVEDSSEYEFVNFPQFLSAQSIPSGMSSNEFLIHSAAEFAVSEGWDGFLGQSWFADRVWEFDYLRKELAYVSSNCEDAELLNEHSCSLGFLTNNEGERLSNFPRIQASIDGETLDFLFDTGAFTILSNDALQSYFQEEEPAARATSFIIHSVFESWRIRHPNWMVIDSADGIMKESMIEVPIVHIAGYDVGPVWFTRRPDHNFHSYMSQWMDRQVDGALGGSMFKYFSIVIDYPNSIAYFTT